MLEAAVRASDITRAYGERRALDGFSLEVPAGGVFGLLGPNGSGKSTFIAMLAAMQAPESGELSVFGQQPSRSLLARTGTVFQENTADPLMRVGEYLAFAGKLFGLPASELRSRIPSVLEQFGLKERQGDLVSSLSGGMRRRLEVARALLHRPSLLLLDEPTTGIDADERAALWRHLLDSSDGVTILLATNDLAEADSVCGRVAFVRAGKVIAAGTPAELKAGLRSESVRITWGDPSPEQLAQLAAIPGTGEIVRHEDTLVVATDAASTLVPKLFEIAPGAIRSVSIAAASLEDAYFQHVGRRAEVAAK